MAEKGTIKFTIYLFRECARAKQQGTILMANPKGKDQMHFDHLDEIPAKIRKQLEAMGLAYDIADDSDETVIQKKKKKRKVVQKTRLGD